MGIINLEECFRIVNMVGYLVFMRCLFVGCIIDVYVLYVFFMFWFSWYIYLWDFEDIEVLIVVGGNVCWKLDGWLCFLYIKSK